MSRWVWTAGGALSAAILGFAVCYDWNPSKKAQRTSEAASPGRSLWREDVGRGSGFGRLRRARHVSVISKHEVSELGGDGSDGTGKRRQKPNVEVFPASVAVPLGVPYKVELYLINNDDEAVIFLKPRLSCGCVGASNAEGMLDSFATRMVVLTLGAVHAKKSERALFPVRASGSTWELEVRIVRERK